MACYHTSRINLQVLFYMKAFIPEIGSQLQVEVHMFTYSNVQNVFVEKRNPLYEKLRDQYDISDAIADAS